MEGAAKRWKDFRVGCCKRYSTEPCSSFYYREERARLRSIARVAESGNGNNPLELRDSNGLERCACRDSPWFNLGAGLAGSGGVYWSAPEGSAAPRVPIAPHTPKGEGAVQLGVCFQPLMSARPGE